MNDIGNLFLALLIINSIIMTFGMRKLTNYNMLHCLFLGLLTGGPLMFLGFVKILDFIAGFFMEIALTLGGSSSKEILLEFVQKFKDQNKVE